VLHSGAAGGINAREGPHQEANYWTINPLFPQLEKYLVLGYGAALKADLGGWRVTADTVAGAYIPAVRRSKEIENRTAPLKPKPGLSGPRGYCC
jgi:hypothetical protein